MNIAPFLNSILHLTIFERINSSKMSNTAVNMLLQIARAPCNSCGKCNDIVQWRKGLTNKKDICNACYVSISRKEASTIQFLRSMQAKNGNSKKRKNASNRDTPSKKIKDENKIEVLDKKQAVRSENVQIIVQQGLIPASLTVSPNENEYLQREGSNSDLNVLPQVDNYPT
jgi:hypothetical protein